MFAKSKIRLKVNFCSRKFNNCYDVFLLGSNICKLFFKSMFFQLENITFKTFLGPQLLCRHCHEIDWRRSRRRCRRSHGRLHHQGISTLRHVQLGMNNPDQKPSSLLCFMLRSCRGYFRNLRKLKNQHLIPN